MLTVPRERRLLQPVQAKDRIRARAMLKSVDDSEPGRVLIKTKFTIDIEGEGKPALAAGIPSLFIVA